MTKALGLSAFALVLATPFVDGLYVLLLGISVFAALIIWVWLRHRELEIDEVKLQCELEGYVRELNRDA